MKLLISTVYGNYSNEVTAKKKHTIFVLHRTKEYSACHSLMTMTKGSRCSDARTKGHFMRHSSFNFSLPWKQISIYQRYTEKKKILRSLQTD
jgi:hypothetical protein